jgi:hypothetical protein
MGFDPLDLADTPESLAWYREAEVKHARLAMLAAFGWPVSEVTNFGKLLTNDGRAPSLLNGGLGEINGIYWGAVIALAVYWESKGLDKQYGKKDNYLPGMLGFDPLGKDSPAMREAIGIAESDLREALANAFVHRDYSVGGGSVNVALYEDRLEIISIGDLHFGLTPEALFREHESKPWNPMIARTFYRRGIIETWGRGTLKIARLMQERGLEPPAVAVRQGAVVITFVLPAPVKTPEKTETPQKTPQKTLQKTPDAIVAILRQQPEVSFAEVAAKLGKSESAIKRAVRKLRESGRLARIGPDKGGHWQVIE